ncbi:hypothetical protein [Comamonas antarctica]|uniref:hypothetical protein n=1 Tax=Comamonas antarctica TaxID=2743470 RepID=UPI0028E378CB|nr:hypothetical protein [Comamonas antarctica]
MPSSSHRYTPISDPWIQQDLVLRHGLQPVAGGYLLTIGRRALNEYGHLRNYDLSLISTVFAEAVAVWADTLQIDRAALEESAKALDRQFLAQEYAPRSRRY